MPLGNGAPAGLPSAQPWFLEDLRLYDRKTISAFGDTGSSLLTRPYLDKLGAYEKTILATPGVAMWWPFAKQIAGVTPGFYSNAAGATTVFATGGGSFAAVSGIIPGSPNPALHLSGGCYLTEADYRVWPMCDEVMLTVEFWVKFNTLATDCGLVGQYDGSGNGWMIYMGNPDDSIIYMANGGHFLSAPTGTIKPGVPFHICAVFGGSQSPTADFVSRLYVNGKQVASGNLAAANNTITTTSGFQINSYAGSPSGGGSHSDMVIQHVIVYNRMLQPVEVAQHYAAGFARL